MNIQARYDILPTTMPLVVKLSNPTTAGDNRRGGSMCRRRWARGTVQGWAVKIVDPDAGCVVSTTNAHTWVDDPPFYPHSTCGSHLQLLHCVTLLLSLTNILFNLFIMLMWLSISCDKTSCVFTSSFFFFSFLLLFYLFSLIFIFWNRMLLCSNGVTSRAFVSGEKTVGGSWCFGVGENWEILMTLNPWWRGCMNTSKIFWFYGNL